MSLEFLFCKCGDDENFLGETVGSGLEFVAAGDWDGDFYAEGAGF